jgi:hypothetical protein
LIASIINGSIIYHHPDSPVAQFFHMEQNPHALGGFFDGLLDIIVQAFLHIL